jgi:hypothetical protein
MEEGRKKRGRAHIPVDVPVEKRRETRLFLCEYLFIMCGELGSQSKVAPVTAGQFSDQGERVCGRKFFPRSHDLRRPFSCPDT